MLPVKAGVAPGAQRLCPGARRSFFCRIKCKQEPAPVKEEAEPDTKHRKKKYCVVQCTGYLKSWAAADVESGGGPEGDDEQCTMSCLVAIGRALPDLTPPAAPAPHTRPLQYATFDLGKTYSLGKSKLSRAES
ncbi:Cycle [Operophtera brumata]|uniref:Cycle n=1 Tax=Operophtera brumata TaxID=104452 RepID=A0A0L7LT84_OPEBR|nr:Cycle [Operophtera brumata]